MTQIKNLTEFIEIINQDNHNCLYCQNYCHYISNVTVDQASFHEIEIYDCRSCSESFSVYKSFLTDQILCAYFTCKDFTLYLDSDNIILRKGNKGIGIVIPITTIDFSNKEALYNKLSIYLTFS